MNDNFTVPTRTVPARYCEKCGRELKPWVLFVNGHALCGICAHNLDSPSDVTVYVLQEST